MAYKDALRRVDIHDRFDVRIGIPVLAITVFCLVFVLVNTISYHKLPLASSRTKNTSSSTKLQVQPVKSNQLITLKPVKQTNLSAKTSKQVSTPPASTSTDQASPSSSSSESTSPLTTIKTADPQSASVGQSTPLQFTQAGNTTEDPNSQTSGGLLQAPTTKINSVLSNLL